MSAQTCIQTSPAFGAACPAPARTHAPEITPSVAPAIPVPQPVARNLQSPVAALNGAAAPSSGFIARLWHAYRGAWLFQTPWRLWPKRTELSGNRQVL